MARMSVRQGTAPRLRHVSDQELGETSGSGALAQPFDKVDRFGMAEKTPAAEMDYFIAKPVRGEFDGTGEAAMREAADGLRLPLSWLGYPAPRIGWLGMGNHCLSYAQQDEPADFLQHAHCECIEFTREKSMCDGVATDFKDFLMIEALSSMRRANSAILSRASCPAREQSCDFA